MPWAQEAVPWTPLLHAGETSSSLGVKQHCLFFPGISDGVHTLLRLLDWPQRQGHGGLLALD